MSFSMSDPRTRASAALRIRFTWNRVSRNDAAIIPRMAEDGITKENREIPIQSGPCCFCGSSITTTRVDPCRLTIETEAGKWQLWFCHGACFKQRLTALPDAPGFFDPAHF